MNERINELVEQAAEYAYTKNDEPLFNKEKFAELIVKECMAQFYNAKVNQEDDVDYGLEEAKNIIKEHFGVEE